MLVASLPLLPPSLPKKHTHPTRSLPRLLLPPPRPTQAEALLRDMVNITVRSDLTKNQRTNLETCITVHMHQKESTEDLVKKKIKDPTDFEWLKQVGGGCMCVWGGAEVAGGRGGARGGFPMLHLHSCAQ